MIPGVAVYFVLFCSMAAMAAFLMWSGVGKSGSPGPKSATSTPRNFSFSASAMTAAVGEAWIRLMRSVECTGAPLRLAGKRMARLTYFSIIYLPESCCGQGAGRSRHFGTQALFDDRRD